MVELREWNYVWNTETEKWNKTEKRRMCFRSWVNAFTFIAKCRELGKGGLAWHYHVYRMAKNGSTVNPIGCVGILFDKFYPSSDEDFKKIQRLCERYLAKVWRDGDKESSYSVGRY